MGCIWTLAAAVEPFSTNEPHSSDALHTREASPIFLLAKGGRYVEVFEAYVSPLLR